MVEPTWGGVDFEPTWSKLVDDLDKLVMMYWGDLLTFEEIAKKTGNDWWTIKSLFKHFDVPRMSTTERAKYNREKNYEMLYRLHKIEGKSLNAIYREYGFSQPYVRLVLKEGQINGDKR